MSIGNYVYKIYFFLCQYSVSLDWRFLTSPPDGGFVRNDNSFCFFGVVVEARLGEPPPLPL